MGFLKNLGIFASCVILYIFNGLLMIAGIVITIKGIYYLCYAREYSKQFVARLLKVDEFYKEVGMSYVLPGGIMIVYSYFGLRGAGQKVTYLLIYSAITIMLISANSYGISSLGSDNKYSLYGYLNKVFISFELGQLSSVAYPEFGVQIALLASCIYLVAVHYWDKMQKEKARRALKEACTQRALLEAEKHQLSQRVEALKTLYYIAQHSERSTNQDTV